MKIKSLYKFSFNTIYPFLLPVFFIFHEYVANFPVIPIMVALCMLGIYILAALILFLIFNQLFKSDGKAALFTLLILSINFFFGTVHDWLKYTFPQLFFLKYTFLLPFLFLLIIGGYYFLQKTNHRFTRIGKFLFLLLIIFLMMDAWKLFINLPLKKEIATVPTLKKCDSCSRPDIYLIITDEYAGSQALVDVFEFNNASFEIQLKNRGFHLVKNSKSNYNATVYSMASLFQMNYLSNISNKVNFHDMFLCEELIKKNPVTTFFEESGYKTYNYSFFDLADKPKAVTNHFFKKSNQLITSQTLVNRVITDLGYHFVSESQKERGKKNNLYNDRIIDSMTRKTVSDRDAPKFVYAHFSMPHHPYYFDSTGNEIDYQMLTDSYNSNPKAYVHYLLYTNKKILDLIDFIKAKSHEPPIILLMSDHGWRQFTEKAKENYYFLNWNAVYFPNGNYNLFYPGMSNVNQFRVLFNTLFNQSLPLLKDTTFFLVE